MKNLRLRFYDREVLATFSVEDGEYFVQSAIFMDDASELDALELIHLEDLNFDVILAELKEVV
jgi:hypothetical protein